MDVRFRVLGPLEVWDGERVVGLTPQQRDLLGLLLCRPNAVVSTDGLISALWGGAPPRTVGKSLQVKVHGLRRVLGEDRLITHKLPGYALTVRPGELDAHRFGELLKRGRAVIAGGRLDVGATLIRQALSLWRGPAFAGQDHLASVTQEAAWLIEQRQTAQEELIEADLACGRHAQVVDELFRLVAENPLRERPRGHLMTARAAGADGSRSCPPRRARPW